ncbi:uncharacterized protein [Gossypium hirsutum]|uniref:Uncharacterized protein n=1 Tax=Gossypium hirsutum TaxID=3635 RepID=A0A1U8P789_GOSHI|nr:uncharacterized protein LOC107955786 [Gossypium hirsutum]
MTGEMIENAVRSDKIEVGESTKRSAPRKRDNEVNNTSTFSKGQSKSLTINQPKTVTANQHSTMRQESNTRPNTERPQFTPIPMTYRGLFQNLFNAYVVSPFYMKPLQPPFPKWYDTNAQCEYHIGITEHLIENCTAFKKLVERFIKMGIVRFDDPAVPNVAGNLLPSHTDQGINELSEGGRKKIKYEVAKVRTPLRRVWKEMVKRGLIALDSREESEEERNYGEFHNEVGHEIQECVEFRALVQDMINNSEMEFYEETGNPEREIYVRQRENRRPRTKQLTTPCVTIPGKENLVDASKEDQDRGSYTRSGRRYDSASEKAEPSKEKAIVVEQKKEKAAKSELLVNEPVNEEEAKEFLKFLKHSEYNVVEQLRKQPARISAVTYVANDIFVNELDRLVSNISADNFIFFNDNEIPPGGRGSTKALHITMRCKGYMLPGVLIDNWSALNVLPLSTLRRLPVDSSHMKECQNIVKAFDGTERRVMGRIEIPLLIGPNTYELKLVSEGWLITINAEDDIIVAVSSDAPYLETNDEVIECSFRYLEFVNATFITEGSKILRLKLSKTTRISLQLMVGKRSSTRKRTWETSSRKG